MSNTEFWFHVAEIAIELATVLVAVIGGYLAIEQIRQVARSVLLARQANTIHTITHCTSRYAAIMEKLPGKPSTESEIQEWWYRYFDLQSEQFTYFQKALLDRDVYELWIQELSRVYQLPPNDHAHLGSRRQRHEKYLKTYLPHHVAMNDFFSELSRISMIGGAQRAEAVHALIEKHAPKPGAIPEGF